MGAEYGEVTIKGERRSDHICEEEGENRQDHRVLDPVTHTVTYGQQQNHGDETCGKRLAHDGLRQREDGQCCRVKSDGDKRELERGWLCVV